MKTVTIEHASQAGQQIRGFRAWQDFAKANFPWAETADRKDGEFRANVKVRSFGDCRLSMIKADDYRVVRTEHGVCRANAECLKVMWLQHGTMAIEQDGRSGRLVPGMAAICDTGRPYRLWLADDVQIVMLALPYTAVPGWGRLSQKVCGTALADRTSLRAALAALLPLLDEPCTSASAANDADPILHAVQWMLSASLHQPAAPGKRAPSPLKLDLAYQYILSHIDDPALSPDELAYALHMSRRKLYQIFEEQQLTPSRYIRDVRLNAVARALRSTRDARRGILEIALDYGFSDSASFSRAFKAAFGLSPSAWRHRESTEAISVEHLIGPIEPHDTVILANSMSNGRTANSP
jgi:AraC family transcriptional activator of tynA and feaB